MGDERKRRTTGELVSAYLADEANGHEDDELLAEARLMADAVVPSQEAVATAYNERMTEVWMKDLTTRIITLETKNNARLELDRLHTRLLIGLVKSVDALQDAMRGVKTLLDEMRVDQRARQGH